MALAHTEPINGGRHVHIGETLYTVFLGECASDLRRWAALHPVLARKLKAVMSAYRDAYCSVVTLAREALASGDTTRFCVIWCGKSDFVGMCRAEPERMTLPGRNAVETVMYVSAVVVAPSHRGHGVCGLLMRELAAGNDGSTIMVLSVEESNAPAMRCYSRAGFRRVPQTPPPHPGYVLMASKRRFVSPH